MAASRFIPSSLRHRRTLRSGPWPYIFERREHQAIESDRPADALGVAASAGKLSLRAERRAARLEVTLAVVAEAAWHVARKLVLDAERVEDRDEQRLDLAAIVGRRPPEQLDANLRELAIAAALRSLVTIARAT